MQQSKYLNNIVEGERRAIERGTRPIGFKRFRCAPALICAIETVPMIRRHEPGDGACVVSFFQTLA